MSTPRLALSLAALALLAGGCQNKVHDENLALHEQNRALQAELNDARTKLSDTEGKLSAAPTAATVSQMEARMQELDAQLKAAQAAAAAQPDPATGAKGDPSLGAGIEAKYDKARGTLTVSLPGEILFDSGKATLKASAGATLDKIAAAIKKDYAAKAVFIDGHTDKSPITKTKDQWEDNWDLAATRANAVRKHLVGKGVDAKNLNLRSFGPNRLKATDGQSRRVEIVVQVG
ncbi:MAG TPA: OmpA family protein [Tepidisphaeraceae bacterium]|nr:OmpA family protein [Tepidisphaeraceae bacterium]